MKATDIVRACLMLSFTLQTTSAERHEQKHSRFLDQASSSSSSSDDVDYPVRNHRSLKKNSFVENNVETWMGTGAATALSHTSTVNGTPCIKGRKGGKKGGKKSSSSGKASSSSARSAAPSTSASPSASPSESSVPSFSASPSAAPSMSSMPSASTMPTRSKGSGKKGGKKGSGKKGKKSRLPYCEDLEAMTTITTDDTSDPQVDTTPAGAPTDTNGNGSITIVTRDCTAISNGQGPVTLHSTSVDLTMRALSTADPNVVVTRLQQTAAARIAGCLGRSANDIVNVVIDSNEGVLATGVICTSGEVALARPHCYSDDLQVQVYFADGDRELTEIERSAILLAIQADPDVAFVDFTDNSDSSSTSTSTTGSGEDDNGVSAARGFGEIKSGSAYGIGSIVGLAVGGVLLMFGILTVGRWQRNRKDHRGAKAYNEYEDEGLSLYNETLVNDSTDDIEISSNLGHATFTGNGVHILGNDDLVLENWKVPDLSIDEQEIMLSPEGTPIYFDTSYTVENTRQYGNDDTVNL